VASEGGQGMLSPALLCPDDGDMIHCSEHPGCPFAA
jgi:hypothetical protein